MRCPSALRESFEVVVLASFGVFAGLTTIQTVSAEGASPYGDVLRTFGSMLEGYYEVPYWRWIGKTGCEPNTELTDRYRKALQDETESAVLARLKILAFAHGQPMDLSTKKLSRDETDLLTKVKAEKGVANDIDLIIELWLTVPPDAPERLRAYSKTHR